MHLPWRRRGRTLGRRLFAQNEVLAQRVGRHFCARTAVAQCRRSLARVCAARRRSLVRYAFPTFTRHLMKNKEHESHRPTDCYSTERAMVGRGQIDTHRPAPFEAGTPPHRSLNAPDSPPWRARSRAVASRALRSLHVGHLWYSGRR